MVNHEDIFTRCEKYSSKLDISRSFICIFVAMTENEKLALQERIIEALKTVYDPEIPVNIYDLGLIYRIELTDDARAEVDMTLTAPNCPAADFIMEDVRMRVEGITGITSATINLVFEPEWDKDMMSEEAKLELGFM
jgi:FeS assembly SUF system protein